jgi:hypothetical protein
MAEAPPSPIIIHSLEEAEAACRAASDMPLPLLLLVSGPGAGLYAGAGWFREVVRLAGLPYPDLPVTAVLDCADQAGIAAEALSSGIGGVIFSGHPEAAEKLRAIAVQTGAALYTDLPAGLDLRGCRDPVEACRRWLSGNLSQ